MPSSTRRTLRSRVFARTETGRARAIGPPSTLREPRGEPVEQARPARRRGSGRSRRTARRRRRRSGRRSPPGGSPRATCQVGSAELSANGSSNCQARAGRVSHASGRRPGTRGARSRGACAASSAYAALVERRVVEPDRERLHRPARRLLHQADDDRRVDPAREERPERNVGDHLLAHRLAEGRAELLDVLAGRAVVLDVPVGVPVALERRAARRARRR